MTPTHDLQLCEDHVRSLRMALTDRGLEPLMATSDAQLEACAKAWVMRGPAPVAASREATVYDLAYRRSYEPIIASTMGLIFDVMALAASDIVAHVQTTNVAPCPLCFVMLRCSCGRGDGCHFRQWVDRAADRERSRACSMGLLGSA